MYKIDFPIPTSTNMTAIIIYSILSIVYLAISFAIHAALPIASVAKWWKKAIYGVIVAPALIVNWVKTASAKLAGISIFAKLISWLAA